MWLVVANFLVSESFVSFGPEVVGVDEINGAQWVSLRNQGLGSATVAGTMEPCHSQSSPKKASERRGGR